MCRLSWGYGAACWGVEGRDRGDGMRLGRGVLAGCRCLLREGVGVGESAVMARDARGPGGQPCLMLGFMGATACAPPGLEDVRCS